MNPRLPELLAARLTALLPGRLVQSRFQPELSYGRHFGPSPTHARPAAVLILLYPHENRWHLPLTLRPAHLPDHGGQVSLMDIVARELRARHGLIVYSSSWYSLPLDSAALAQFDAREHRFGIHAGEIETSMMLATRPQFVDMDQARDFASTVILRSWRAAPDRLRVVFARLGAWTQSRV